MRRINTNVMRPQTNSKNEATAKVNYVKPSLQEIDGLLLPKYGGFSAEKLSFAVNFTPELDDVLVATYPTCATAWTQYMVWEIVRNGAPLPEPQNLNDTYFPLLELSGIKSSLSEDQVQSPRMIKIHTPATHSPYRGEHRGKFIYVCRNPKDCLMSYYYLHLQLPQTFGFRGTFEDFFQSFLSGQTAWGSYFDHVLSWFEMRRNRNVLFLTYDKMATDEAGTVLQIAKFLGDQFVKLKEDGTVIKRIVSLITADKANKGANKGGRRKSTNQKRIWSKVFGQEVGQKEMDMIRYNDQVDFSRFAEIDGSNIIRQDTGVEGLHGGWRNSLSEEQNRIVDLKITEKFAHTYLCDLWRSKTF